MSDPRRAASQVGSSAETVRGMVCDPLGDAHLYMLRGARWECVCGAEGGHGKKGWDRHVNRAVAAQCAPRRPDLA